MKFTINFKADTPNKNNHIYPKSVLKKSFDTIMENQIYVISKPPISNILNMFDFIDIKYIVGEVKGYEINGFNDIIIDVNVMNDILTYLPLTNKQITTYGIGFLNQCGVIKDDYILSGFFICDDK